MNNEDDVQTGCTVKTVSIRSEPSLMIGRGFLKKREPPGADRMLISIALKHPEVRQEVAA